MDIAPPAAGAGAGAAFWLEGVTHNGVAAFNANPAGYQVFRNVKSFGAVGDGVTDDTAAINRAISEGNRCGAGCDSSTTAPALVYFPAGEYLVSSPIISYYYTQLVGNPNDLPTLVAAPAFEGIAVIDEDPYLPGGANWYTNQNNFFRSVSNLIIDLTRMPATVGTGIHHQVSQATGLFNVRFQMRTDVGTQQAGIFMENGSGGFMANLRFFGGRYGAVFGNQQFTLRDSRFERCGTAISQIWAWEWTYKGIEIESCGLGIELRTVTPTGAADGPQGAASVLATDWSIRNTPQAFRLTTPGAGVLVLDNIETINVRSIVIEGPAAATPVAGPGAPAAGGGQVLLAGSTGTRTVTNWVRGPVYRAVGPGGGPGGVQRVQGTLAPWIRRPSVLVQAGDARQRWFKRDRPQYQDKTPADFVNVKDYGCRGDGRTDDHDRFQSVLDDFASRKIIWGEWRRLSQAARDSGLRSTSRDDADRFLCRCLSASPHLPPRTVPHGTYLLSRTLRIPPGTRMVGEVWPVLMGYGSRFQNAAVPRPVVQVGRPGEEGIVEISDMIFSTRGPAAGAVVVQWNIRQSSQGSAGMWDSHIRVGGTAGSNLEADRCARRNALSPGCDGSFLNLHLTPSSSAYLENVWVWTADHDLDLGSKQQINVVSARGVLVESRDGPVWLYGTASEHSVLYQYNIVGARNVVVMLAQTETAYFQGRGRPPASDEVRGARAAYGDPDLARFGGDTSQNRGLGLRIAASSDVFVYGAGLYSFFDNYSQECIATRSCQRRIVSLERLTARSNVWILNLNTVGTQKVVTLDEDDDVVDEGALRNGFTNTLAVWDSETGWRPRPPPGAGTPRPPTATATATAVAPARPPDTVPVTAVQPAPPPRPPLPPHPRPRTDDAA
ncbi:related to beta-1,3 exoglucanase precursor [Pseudozyma flocculosa]|uniref:Related to beta-1,3 exoglucanase n=1 Tax=Pseudozyma flocculosa TaxID=84751 RepID=A0A5C3ETF4_9BASI|nr:related to beta-1,3 exoglucanase precursor [Pseudozyma flocculosa]